MEDKLKIEEVEEIDKQLESDNRERDLLYARIKNAVDCIFEPDSQVSQLPFIQGRKFALPDIADARNAGSRAFTALLPNINILPTADNQGEYERVDKLEAAWDFELARMNRPVNGVKGIHDQIVESALTFHAVALQTEYLPYKFKGMEKDNRVKALLRRKCFNWTLHDPMSVYSQSSEYGLERVMKRGEINAQQLIDRYGMENEGVKKMLADMKNPKRQDLLKTTFMLKDYTDWTHRVEYAKPKGGGAKSYEFRNEKHGLPFINWVIVDYGDPIWKAIIQSGAWDNLQHMRLIKFSKAVAQAGKPDFYITTMDGTLKGVWIDWSNPLNPMVVPSGAELGELRENRLDPQFEAEYQEERGDVARSTVSRVLQDPTPYINAPFSTLSASVNMTLGQLTPAKRVAETSTAEAIHQSMEWVKYSEIPFVVYRPYSSDSKIDGQNGYQKGEQIVISHNEAPTEEEIAKMSPQEYELFKKTVYFDLSALQIDVQLQSANMIDEQSRLNVLINAKDKLGMSEQEAWERMGWNNYKQNQIQSAFEVLFKTQVGKIAELEMLEVQQAQMDKQQAAQNQQMAQEQQAMAQEQGEMVNNDIRAMSQFSTVQGQDMRSGMNPAAMTAPFETREQINGQARNGESI